MAGKRLQLTGNALLLTLYSDARRWITLAHDRKPVVGDAAAPAADRYTLASDAYTFAVDAAHAIHDRKHNANVCSQSIIARKRHAYVEARCADTASAFRCGASVSERPTLS